jgi:uncharacterized protein (TIGR02996 family)
VLDAFRAGDRRALLEVLVAVWRECRAPEIADLIDEVSNDVTAAVGPIPGRNREERGALWSALEKQRRVEDVPRLVAGVVDCLRKDAEDRVRRMAAWVVDPRASKILVAWIVSPPNGYVGSRASRFWRSITGWLGEIRDVRALPELERLVVEYRDSHQGTLINTYLPGMLELAAQELRKVEVGPLGAAWVDAIAEMRSRRDPTSAEELLRQVYLNPHDLELRAVLGDVLQSLGDPRGELIALQLAAQQSRSTRQQKKREKELIAQHGRAWLGAIEPVIHKSGVKFEAGFLAQARAGMHETRRTQAAIGCDEWSTVHTLDVEPWIQENVAALIGHDSMRSLRVLIGAHESVFTIARPLLLESLALRYSNELAVRLIADCRSMPKLRRLDLGVTWIEPGELQIWGSPIGTNLQELAVQAGIDPLPWILAAQPIDAPALETIEVRPSNHHPWGVVLGRDGERRFTLLRLFVGWPYEMASAIDDLIPLLEQIPAELPTRLEIRLHANTHDPTQQQLTRLQQTLKRFTNLVDLPVPSRG